MLTGLNCGAFVARLYRYVTVTLLFVFSRPRRLSLHGRGRATVTAHGGLGCFDKVDQVKPECSLGSTVVFHGTVAPAYDGNAHTIGTARRGAGAALQHSAADSSDHAGAHCEYR